MLVYEWLLRFCIVCDDFLEKGGGGLDFYVLVILNL